MKQLEVDQRAVLRFAPVDNEGTPLDVLDVTLPTSSNPSVVVEPRVVNDVPEPFAFNAICDVAGATATLTAVVTAGKGSAEYRVDLEFVEDTAGYPSGGAIEVSIEER